MIALGCDHGGLPLMEDVRKHLAERGEEVKDFGTFESASCDYPDFAKAVCQSILSGECDRGILICGTGIGISMAANRFKGIRAGLCTDAYMAKMTREHNDANILAMGARTTGPGTAIMIVDTFLDTPFSNGERHINRIRKMDED